jgi:hypothetical protein
MNVSLIVAAASMVATTTTQDPAMALERFLTTDMEQQKAMGTGLTRTHRIKPASGLLIGDNRPEARVSNHPERGPARAVGRFLAHSAALAVEAYSASP